jgi:hypothetical protein
MKPLIALAATLALTGCVSQNVEFYPVEGPLAAQVPLPVIQAKAEGVEGNSGRLTLTRPNGETCSGRWSSAAPQFAAVSSGSLFSIYGGALFGSSVTTGIQPGVNQGQAFLSCSAGTTMQAEFVTGSGTANGYGVAKDSEGNVYRMLF